MAEEQPSLHIDTDWKKQAQEEKRRLAEEEQKRAAERERSTAATAPIPTGSPASAGAAAPAAAPGRGRPGPAGARGAGREVPEASLGTLVNSLMTQVLLYLGELAPRGVEPQVNLDMAKFNIDLLGVLEQKSKGNLTPDETKLLDTALYETRMRYVQVASQYATV
jgi:hypothetical protein